VVLLSGGVGGARLARGLAAVLPQDRLTVVVNVGDDERVYGVHVSPDVDTVVYTLAGIEGPHGWGIAGDTFTVMDALAALGADTAFRLGDRDLATCLRRTAALDGGVPLSVVTGEIAAAVGVAPRILPATDDPVATRVRVDDGWIDFQEYFVVRGHRDEVRDLDYGADAARPAPGVVEEIDRADVVVIAPSNPPLSIWPMLAVAGLREAVAAAHDRVPVVAVSPLFGGRALKGPADRVMAARGLPPGNRGVAAAYAGLISHLVIDAGDADDVAGLAGTGLTVTATDTRIAAAGPAAAFASRLLGGVAA
jgi:LPPG:FO 2-phospho-L-lactate transferase